MWEIPHKSPKRIKKDNIVSYPATPARNMQEKKLQYPYLAAVCFRHQKRSAHTRPLHSSKFLYQRRWPFWSKSRNIFFHPVHGCCGWECKWYWGGILLSPLWTRTRCVPPDTWGRFLHSWSGESTGKSLTHPDGLICFVSHGESSDLCSLCEVEKEKAHYFWNLYQIKPRYACTLPFTIKTVPFVNDMSYAVPVWHKYVASSSLETFLITKRYRESSFVAVNLDVLNCPWTDTLS